MGDIAKSLAKIAGRGGSTTDARRPFEPKPDVGAKPPEVSKGKAAGKGGSSGDNLTELSYETREFWPERTIYSSDGAISMRVRPVKAVVLTNGQRLEFKEPT